VTAEARTCDSPFMSVAKSYPCAASECSGHVEIATAGTGTCPVCRLAEVLDANTDRLRVDAAATLDEERLARAEHNSYLSTAPLAFGQDAPTFDSEAFGRARRRLDNAQTGMASLRAYRGKETS
jgi:hypothetical protein